VRHRIVQEIVDAYERVDLAGRSAEPRSTEPR